MKNPSLSHANYNAPLRSNAASQENGNEPFEEQNEGLEPPNLYHFNINNETEDQAVTRLDGEIRVCMRQYTINAIRDRHLELPDVKEMMKLYLKLVSQELKARELAIKERLLNLREREVARKEAAETALEKADPQAGQTAGSQSAKILNEGGAIKSTPSQVKNSDETASQNPSPAKIKVAKSSSATKSRSNDILAKNAPALRKEEPCPNTPKNAACGESSSTFTQLDRPTNLPIPKPPQGDRPLNAHTASS